MATDLTKSVHTIARTTKTESSCQNSIRL